MNKRILILFILVSGFTYAQSGLTEWDKTYELTTAEDVIHYERDYARAVEKDTAEAQYYVAMRKYRFIAEYTGHKRPIDSEVLQSMRNVFKLKMGRTDILNDLVSQEMEFDIGGSKVWMPIQNQLIDDIEYEASPGQKILLYCLFTNEHRSDDRLFNTFFISEFLTRWE